MSNKRVWACGIGLGLVLAASSKCQGRHESAPMPYGVDETTVTSEHVLSMDQMATARQIGERMLDENVLQLSPIVEQGII